MGEVPEYDIGYVADYQRHGLNSILDYPIWFAMSSVFRGYDTMYQLSNVMKHSKREYKDMSVLGVFNDNHDQPRFMGHGHPSVNQLKATFVFTMFSHGIPIIYYGSEHAFDGGDDPACREPMWRSGMRTDGELYGFIKELNQIRRNHKVWEHDHVERWVDNDMFVWSRGFILIATTNRQYKVERRVNYHPFKPGQRVCNLLFDGDCVTITSDSLLHIVLEQGEQKIYAAV